ncbi:MAG TPA: proton-conducting transporter membrane subunit, partial [Nitrospira sp.]|nr:proton-conducting transporter membrane subunit [Nitrospira sp.]
MTAALLVPLFPLLTVLLVVAGKEATRRQRVKIGAWPLAAAFLGAIFTLYVVATSGPISVRFYDPAEGSMLPVPIGFHVDRLSAVMMVLISAIGTIIYTYSLDYMYQEPHERRYFATLGVAICVLLCMVSSGNLMMLFVFWQILGYLLYVLIHNHAHAGTLEGAFRTFTILRIGDIAFLAAIALAYSLYGTLEFPDIFAAAAQSTASVSLLPGIELHGATAVA